MLDFVVFWINCSVFKGRFCGPIVVYKRQNILLIAYLTIIASTFVSIISLAMRG
jgi:hypothetical protein